MKTEVLAHETKLREKDPPAVEDPSRKEIQEAIARAFGEYRRRIADIRALHGRKARMSLHLS